MAKLGPGDTFAGLRIVRPLGAGGMGEVYVAEHPGLRRPEALKIIRAETIDPQVTHRFVNEARVVAALDHPSIVTIYGFGVHDGSPWFTMQYLNAVDLTECGAQRPNVVGRIVADAASALDYAHTQGVLHRDVKPANIATVLGPRGQVQRVVVLDFGIARMADSTRLTAEGAFLGSVAYSAPETLQHGTWSERSDQYSLACAAFELLTGSQAFRAGTVGELVRQHVLGEVPVPSSRNPALAPYDGVFARALAKNPADRFPTCGHFAAAFTAVERGIGSGPQRYSGPVPPMAEPPTRLIAAPPRRFPAAIAAPLVSATGGPPPPSRPTEVQQDAQQDVGVRSRAIGVGAGLGGRLANTTPREMARVVIRGLRHVGDVLRAAGWPVLLLLLVAAALGGLGWTLYVGGLTPFGEYRSEYGYLYPNQQNGTAGIVAMWIGGGIALIAVGVWRWRWRSQRRRTGRS